MPPQCQWSDTHNLAYSVADNLQAFLQPRYSIDCTGLSFKTFEYKQLQIIFFNILPTAMTEQELLDKRRQFQSHLAKQQKEREEAQALKRKKDLLQTNLSQKMLVIQKQFRSRLQELEGLLPKYSNREAPYEEVIAKYNALKAYYLEINYALYTYDRQSYKEILERVLAQIQELKKKLEPRKKFKFSRRDEDFGVKLVKQEQKLQHKEGYESSVPGLINISNQTITIPSSQLGGPYKIIKGENCTIYLNGVTDILFLKELKNCKVRAGPTKSTVFVDKCVGCEIEISCHQLRIHNTEDTKFGVFTSSKGIIQDTKNVVFKRYNYKYEGIEEDIKQCDRQGKENLWRDIQDFNWLKQEASPNFTLVDSLEFQE